MFTFWKFLPNLQFLKLKHSIKITLFGDFNRFFCKITILESLCENNNDIATVVECSPITRETGVQSQVVSYQGLKKWKLTPPCKTLSTIRYGFKGKWSNPENGVAQSTTSLCSSYWRGRLWVTLDYGRLTYFLEGFKLKICRKIKSSAYYSINFLYLYSKLRILIFVKLKK